MFTSKVSPNPHLLAQMKLTPFLLSIVVMTGCAYQLSTFQYYSAPNEIPNSSFYYVAYNLSGKATATYAVSPYGVVSGGNQIIDGLVADAKRDLMNQHPLGPNELYANWCIDQVNTETGTRFGESQKASRYDVSVVVSADIMKLGTPTPDELAQYQQAVSPQIRASGSFDETTTKTNDSGNFADAEINEAAPTAYAEAPIENILEGERLDGEVQVGDVVTFTWRGAKNEGTVAALTRDTTGKQWARVEFLEGGKVRKKSFLLSQLELFQKAED